MEQGRTKVIAGEARLDIFPGMSFRACDPGRDVCCCPSLAGWPFLVAVALRSRRALQKGRVVVA